MITGWSTLVRYRLVFCWLNAPLTRVIGSFSGTSAIGAAWFLAANSSSRPWEVPGVPALLRSGAVNGVHPSAGSRNPFSSALSLPLLITVDPASAAVLAALSCAVWPLPLSKYCVVTLSLWSWSIIVKLRVVGQVSPGTLVDVATAGIVVRPAAMSLLTAAKNATPLQKDTWPKIEPARPLTHFAPPRVAPVAPFSVRLVPLKPKSRVTTAPAGSVGTTGPAAGWGPWANAPRLAKLAMVQPDACGDIPLGPVSW